MGRPRKPRNGISVAAGPNARQPCTSMVQTVACAFADQHSIQPAAHHGHFPDGHKSTAGHGQFYDEDDEDAAEFRREAAELVKQIQRPNSLPGGLQQKQLDAAVQSLVSQTGISRLQAQEALLATADNHSEDFDQWINEALVWLAVQVEVQDEADKMKQAMEISLAEQEAARVARASGPPLANLSEQRLRKRFKDSALLHALQPLLPGSVLFSDRAPLREIVKHKLVDYLRLEADCCKWWPGDGTDKFFNDTAGKIQQQLSQASSSNASTTSAKTASEHECSALAPATAQASATATPVGQTAKPVSGMQDQPVGLPDPSTIGAHTVDPTSREQVLICQAASTGTAQTLAQVATADGDAAAASCVAGVDIARPGSVSREHVSTEAVSGARQAAQQDSAEGHEAGQPCSLGVRVSVRQRQQPARYRSPSPADAGTSQKRQPSADSSHPPAKRQALAEQKHHAAASNAPLQATHTAAACAAVCQQPNLSPVAGKAVQQPPRSCPQQLPQVTQASHQQLQAPQLPPAAVDDRSDDPMEVYRPVWVRLAQLLHVELQQLRHHVFDMPAKAGAMPAIFQSLDALQACDGDDSDIELVELTQEEQVLTPDPLDSPLSSEQPLKHVSHQRSPNAGSSGCSVSQA